MSRSPLSENNLSAFRHIFKPHMVKRTKIHNIGGGSGRIKHLVAKHKKQRAGAFP
jgi:hypothetical protein